MFSTISKSIELYIGKNRRSMVEQAIPAPLVDFSVEDYSRLLVTMNTSEGLSSSSYGRTSHVYNLAIHIRVRIVLHA